MCEQCREELSARLDGEDDPAQRPAVDAHVSGCEECQRWSDDAAAVTRLIRMSVVTAGPPAIRETVLDAAPGPGRSRVAGGLRIALGVLGAAQFALGMAQVSAVSAAGHDHAGVGVSSAHLWHESAAWNVALGAGFGWIAVRRSRPSGLVPLLTAFVGLLILLSANDYWMGQVDGSRLFSHGLIVAGYLIVVALTRPSFDFGEPPPQRMRAPGRWSVRFDDEDAPAAARHLRALRSHLPLQSARHDRAA
jgi:predicted anti-sigma-YlaC factor YlaD